MRSPTQEYYLQYSQLDKIVIYNLHIGKINQEKFVFLDPHSLVLQAFRLQPKTLGSSSNVLFSLLCYLAVAVLLVIVEARMLMRKRNQDSLSEYI